jgi:uncharacterized protein (TIGR02246 family)
MTSRAAEPLVTTLPETLLPETAVRQLVAALEERWNAGDGAGYAALFTQDADYVAFNGAHAKGRLENARNHQRLFDTWLKGSVLQGEIKDLRFLTPDVALVHLVGNVRLRWQRTPNRARDSIQTLVAVNTLEGWRFAAFHNTRITPPSLWTNFMLMLGRR